MFWCEREHVRTRARAFPLVRLLRREPSLQPLLLLGFGWNLSVFILLTIMEVVVIFQAFLWLSDKESTCQCRRCRRLGFNPWVRKIPWRRVWQPTPLFLPGESHKQRSLVGYSPWGHKKLDRTEQLSSHTKSNGSKSKNKWWNLIKLKRFCRAKEIVKLME